MRQVIKLNLLFVIPLTRLSSGVVFLLQKEALYLNMNVYKLPTMETK